MKKICSLTGLLLICSVLFSQVGIGTLTPNTRSLLELSSTSKGLLLPRMTSSDRASMPLTAADAGMMVYQTNAPKGPYTWDGTGWIYHAPIEAGSTTSTTLRWDNSSSKWVAAGNLYNGGGSIGINTNSTANYQFQINSNGPATTRLQITTQATGVQQADGLIIGIAQPSGMAHILQQENRAITIGTNGLERVRLDSIGRLGINTTDPMSYLDVNGSFKLGSAGTPLQSIMRLNFETDPPEIAAFAEWLCNIPCPNTTTDAVVYVSPGDNMDHIMIGYSRVNSAGNVQVKFMNMSSIPVNIGTVMLHISVIQ